MPEAITQADVREWQKPKRNGEHDIFAEFTRSHDLIRVKTTNMGSMFKLTYNVELADATREKEMIDKLRCRNGNLEIAVSKQETVGTEL